MKKCPLAKVLTIVKVAFKKLPIHSSSVTLGLCVTILDTSEPEKHLNAGAVTMPVPHGVGINPRHKSVSVWA